ncbi:AAA family ATPase [Weissella paramesenteroides]
MFIKSISLHNFKSFSSNTFEDIKIEFTAGVNYLIGNNNVGKTTILNALAFLKTGDKKENVISKGHEQEDVSVTITIDDVDLFEEDSLKKYNPYIEGKQLILQRSSKKIQLSKVEMINQKR